MHSVVRCVKKILSALDLIAGDDRIRAVVVTGEGRGFSAEVISIILKQVRENKDEEKFRSYSRRARKSRARCAHSRNP